MDKCGSTILGESYTGTMAVGFVSVNEYPCQHWVNHTSFHTGNLSSLSENYCRNPDNDEKGIWCFGEARNNSNVKVYCNAPYCGNKKFNGSMDCKMNRRELIILVTYLIQTEDFTVCLA